MLYRPASTRGIRYLPKDLSMTLALHSCGPEGTLSEADLSATALPAGIVWIDMMAPTREESAFIERATGLRVPGPEELSEIETSSRLRTEKGVLYLSTPAVFRKDGLPVTTPLGFVLSADHLITIRFAPLPAFETFKSEIKIPDNVHASSAGAFAGLLETAVDRMADVLEQVGAELDSISHNVFRSRDKTDKKQPARAERDLRDTMRAIGRSGDLISKIRDSLTGIGRIVPYTLGHCVSWMPHEVRTTLETLRADVTSLNDYDSYLTNKVQFLLDATLGLINIEQNNIIKVLTVVSVVGVPPTLVASWYGMNFKTMPELDWAYGYPYVMVIALLSAILPVVYFRVKGWF
jgi:magnesium transporter